MCQLFIEVSHVHYRPATSTIPNEIYQSLITDMPTTILVDAKPCPFCGSTRIVKGDRYFAMCVDCGATGPERNADATERKFVGDWNTRVGAPNVTRPLETEGRTAIKRIAVADAPAPNDK